MSDTPCAVCDRPVPDAYVCQACTLDVERALGDVRWLDHELDVVLAKQTAGVASIGYTKRVEREQPLPYDPRATEVRWVLTNTITTWARIVEDSQMRARMPAIGGIGILAAWLASYSGALRLLDQGEAVGDILAAVRSARALVDVRPERWYAGPCEGHDGEGCGHDLYARPNASRVTCPACGASYDTTDRREWLLKAAHDHLGTAREVVALCKAMLGDLVSEDMLRGYVRRGRLAAHGSTIDRRGRVVATYRVGDVIDVAKQVRWDEREQRATRRAGRPA